MPQTSLKGDAQIIGQDLFAISSAANLSPLGTLATAGDGRYYRYVLCDGTTAVVVGKLYQGSAEATTWQNLACAAAAVGATSITTTTTLTATLNQMAGGYVTVTASTGLGYTYKIKGNTAASSAVCTIYLEDPILVAMTVTTSTIDIILSPYAGVVLSNSTISSAPVGVSVFPITAAYYGWLQVRGPASVLADGSIAVGDIVVASNGTSGAVEIGANASTEAQAPVGTALTGISTTEYGFIMLHIS